MTQRGSRTRTFRCALSAQMTLALTMGLVAGSASAHVCMDVPVSRVGPSCTYASPQKVGPCGVQGRTSYVSEFRPGQTITVQLNETIDHPSHYRIAFNPNGDAFEDPTSADDKNGDHPFVLLDGIVDASTAKQSVQVTLPDISCDNCTLQLIQVMLDKGSNGFGGRDGVAPDNDDIYYACADIVLKSGAGTDAGAGPSDAGVGPSGDASDSKQDAGTAGEPDGAPNADDGCSVSVGASSHGRGYWGLGALVLGATLIRLRRRRPPH